MLTVFDSPFIKTMFKGQAQPSSQLCDHCHKKPKHVGHPYCSRTCAKEASSVASSKTCIQCHQRPKFQGFDFCSKTCARAAQAAKPSQGPNHQQKQQTITTRTTAPQNNPFIPPAPAAFPTLTGITPVTSRSPPIQASVPPLAHTDNCRIDGCWEPVETDRRGFKISDYCSQEHAEEAVLSGLAKGCVMCLRMPQSDSDYFCTQACRDKSMHK